MGTSSTRLGSLNIERFLSSCSSSPAEKLDGPVIGCLLSTVVVSDTPKVHFHRRVLIPKKVEQSGISVGICGQTSDAHAQGSDHPLGLHECPSQLFRHVVGYLHVQQVDVAVKSGAVLIIKLTNHGSKASRGIVGCRWIADHHQRHDALDPAEVFAISSILSGDGNNNERARTQGSSIWECAFVSEFGNFYVTARLASPRLHACQHSNSNGPFSLFGFRLTICSLSIETNNPIFIIDVCSRIAWLYHGPRRRSYWICSSARGMTVNDGSTGMMGAAATAVIDMAVYTRTIPWSGPLPC
jgi:hypothetical protein